MNIAEYQPWSGDRYPSAPQRLLLLGKAHYGVPSAVDSPSLTAELIRRVRDGAAHEPFFTKTADLVKQCMSPRPISTAEFWDRVAFANYIPANVGPGVHDAPTDGMWHRAQARLLELVESLAPTHVLSLGKEQWNRISFPAGWISESVSRTPRGTIQRWRSPGVSILGTPIDHPSASHGFRVDDWVEHVREFLQLSPVAPLASDER